MTSLWFDILDPGDRQFESRPGSMLCEASVSFYHLVLVDVEPLTIELSLSDWYDGNIMNLPLFFFSYLTTL